MVSCILTNYFKVKDVILTFLLICKDNKVNVGVTSKKLILEK